MLKIDMYMAAIMSMILPGLGQLYCAFGMVHERGKQYVKCLIIITLFLMTVLSFYTVVLALFIWVLNVIDAVQTARLIRDSRYTWKPLVLSAKKKDT